MNRRSLDFDSMVEIADMDEKLTCQNVTLSVDGIMSFVQPLDSFEIYTYEGKEQNFLCLGAMALENGFMDIPFSKIKNITSEENIVSDFDTYYIELVDNTEITLNV